MTDELDEIAAVKTIYGDELTVDRYCTAGGIEGTRIERRIPPVNNDGQSLVSVILSMDLDNRYIHDHRTPIVQLRQPRGLSDSGLAELNSEIRQHLTENLGQPVIYEINMLVADFLVKCDRIPPDPCPICLQTLANRPITRTVCDHFYHRSCFDQYRRHFETLRDNIDPLEEEMTRENGEEIVKPFQCSICRCQLDEDSSQWNDEPDDPKIEDESNEEGEGRDYRSQLSQWRMVQAALSDVYEKQRLNGGLIDLEEIKNRNLITEDTIVVLPSRQPNPEPSIAASTANTSTVSMNNGGRPSTVPMNNGGRRRRGRGRGGGEYRRMPLPDRDNGGYGSRGRGSTGTNGSGRVYQSDGKRRDQRDTVNCEKFNQPET